MTKKNWTDTELDRLAHKLIEQFPERGFAAVKQPYEVKLSDLEFTPVLHACLPAERHGLRPKISRLKRDLVKAFGRIAAQDTGNPSGMEHTDEPGIGDEAGSSTRIRWGQEDWRFCALALHTMCPELDLLNAPNLSKVTLDQLNLAVSAMAQGRQRTFKRLADATDRLAEVYREARETRDPFYFGRAGDSQAAAPQQADAHPTHPAPEKLPDAPAPVLHTPLRPGIYWTAEEYKAIAAELRHSWPHVLEDGRLPGLNITDLNIAIRKALPVERQRRMANQAHIRSFGNRLRDALVGKPIWTAEQFVEHGLIEAAPAAPAAPAETPAEAPAAPAERDFRSGPRVFWSAEEWDTLIRKLYEKYPQVQARFRDLTLSMLNDTAQKMERPRRFFSVSATLKHLEPAVERVRQASAAAPAEPAPAAAPTPAPAPEPIVAQATPAADKLFAKIEWTRQEWLLIAEELHKLFPAHNYPYGQSLVGLDTEDIAFAQQRVLPLERQRRHLKVVSFSTLRAPLERAFADLRAVLEGKPPACILAVPAAPAAVSAPAPAPEPVAPPAPALELTAAPEAPAAGALDPYRAAFEPLVALLGAEVAKHLGPMIQTMVEQAVARLPAPVVQLPPAAAPAYGAPHLVASTTPPAGAAPGVPKNYGDDKPRAEKQKKLVVGILVNRTSQYKQELEKTFPMLEVRCIDTDCEASIDRLSLADKVFAMERFINHSAGRKLKKLVGDRYSPCNGAMSELKRIIAMWLRTEGITLEQVA